MLALLFNLARSEFDTALQAFVAGKEKFKDTKADKSDRHSSVYLKVLCKFQDDFLTQFWDIDKDGSAPQGKVTDKESASGIGRTFRTSSSI